VPWESFVNEPPAGQLRLTSSATANFTANLITSIARTPPSTIFSTGGDGLNANCYTQDAQIQADLIQSRRILEPALDAFTQSTHGALKAIGKMLVVWEGKGCQSLNRNQSVDLGLQKWHSHTM